MDNLTLHLVKMFSVNFLIPGTFDFVINFLKEIIKLYILATDVKLIYHGQTAVRRKRKT